MHRSLKRHNEFIGHVAVMMSGRTVAALVALFTMPIVARLYLPSDFGVAAVFASFISMVSQSSSLRYEGAIVLPKDAGEAMAVKALAYRILWAAAALALLLLAIYESAGPSWTTLDLLGVWKWLLPAGLLLAGTVHIQECWLIRNKGYGRTSASLLAASTTNSGTRIGLGAWLGSSAWALIAGHLLGMGSQVLVQRFGWKTEVRASTYRAGWAAMKEMARRYADFPKLNAPATLVHNIGSHLPILLFGTLFSPAAAGLYAMADRLSQVPLGIVAESIRRVFLQKAVAITNAGRSLRKAFLLVIGGLALAGLVPFAILWLYGQQLLTFVLGERWSDAGRYLEIMAPWLFSVWVASPCNAVFIVLRAQGFFLVRQTVLAVLKVAVFVLTYLLTADPEWTLRAFAMVIVAANVVTIGQALRIIGQREMNAAS